MNKPRYRWRKKIILDYPFLNTPAAISNSLVFDRVITDIFNCSCESSIIIYGVTVMMTVLNGWCRLGLHFENTWQILKQVIKKTVINQWDQ